VKKLLALALAITLIAPAMAQQRVRVSFSRHRTVTPSDTVQQTNCQRLYVTGAGNLVIEDDLNIQITYAVVAGQFLEFVPFRVRTTSTATGIVCWY